MIKMTESEAQQFVTAEGLNWDDAPEVVRECGHCESWVLVDDYSGDEECCDACA